MANAPVTVPTIHVTLRRTGHHEKYISLELTRLNGNPARPQRFYFSFRPEEIEPFVNVLVNALMDLPKLVDGQQLRYVEEI